MTLTSGHILPQDGRARRAVKAIDEKRFDDAAKHISAIPDDSIVTQAWKSYLSGCLAWAQHDICAAEVSLTNCVQTLSSKTPNGRDSTGHDVMRLIAAAHELYGSVLRRQDRPEESLKHHQKAYQLRQDFGSPEERFESATSMGITHRILRQQNEARSWFERSKQHAESCATGHRALVASALSNLATVYEATQPQDALNAAIEAQAIWYDYDPTSSEALLADVAVGNRLLGLGQSLLESIDPHAGTTLAEAVHTLTKCQIALNACGPAQHETALLVAERLDFAKRLASSLIAEP